jgi:hypothetical protein
VDHHVDGESLRLRTTTTTDPVTARTDPGSGLRAIMETRCKRESLQDHIGVTVHHVGKDGHDPQLRQALAQRPARGNRGR